MQAIKLTPWLIRLRKENTTLFFCFVLFVCLFVFSNRPDDKHMLALEWPSWSYGARVGRASNKCDQAFIPLHPFLRGVYPLLAINSPKNSKWGRRIIIQRKNLQHPHLLLLFQQQIYLLLLLVAFGFEVSIKHSVLHFVDCT